VIRWRFTLQQTYSRSSTWFDVQQVKVERSSDTVVTNGKVRKRAGCTKESSN